jgi:hypothetical protein
MRATLKCNRHREIDTSALQPSRDGTIKKNAHNKSKGKKRNGSKRRAAIMESITSLLKRSLNRA